MNKIEKELAAKGWINTRIDKDMTCASWPEKHVRVSMWDSNHPTHWSKTGEAIGFEYADGDGATITEAFEHLKRNIKKGYSKFFPGVYVNDVEKDYKKWKSLRKKK